MLAAPVSPIAAHPLLVFLLQIGFLLLLAILLGRLAARIGMPAVVGELCAGVILGPSLFGWLAPGVSDWLLPEQPAQMHLLDAVGQVGVLLLVGLTGIEMDLGLIRRRSLTALRVSLAGLVVPLASGIGLGYLLVGLVHPGSAGTDVFALFLGVAMCVTAIPVIAKMLMDMNLIHRNIGQLTLAAGMVDDAFGWFLLSVVSAMAVGGVSHGKIAAALLYLLAVVVVAVLIGRYAVRFALRLSKKSVETTIATAVVMILLAAAATQALGLEAIFGAFICGILIGSSGEFIQARTAALRTLVLAFLAPVFFATAGLRMDLRALAKPEILVAALIVLATAILGKFAGAYIGARLSRLNRWEALALGAGMNARGIIEVIVAMVGLRLGVLGTDTYTIIVLVAVVTSLMAPPILRMAMKRVEYTAEERLRLSERVDSTVAR
jgi:Kef-type K+ transport system membrane component KefB